jgi:acyl-CoA reductase-like NAD-dependent aldehyde dehydrogenase
MLELKDPDLFRQQCFLNGEWVDARSGETITVRNPADGSVLGTVPKMGADETRAAIEAADAAWPAWRSKLAKERSAILRKWFDLIVANQEDLAVLMTNNRVRHVPVLINGRLAGIVSIGDVVKNRMEEMVAERQQLRAYITQGG